MRIGEIRPFYSPEASFVATGTSFGIYGCKRSLFDAACHNKVSCISANLGKERLICHEQLV